MEKPLDYSALLHPGERHLDPSDPDHSELVADILDTLKYLHNAATEPDIEGCAPPELMDKTSGRSTPWIGLEGRADDPEYSHIVQARYVSFQIAGLYQREILQVRFRNGAEGGFTEPRAQVLIGRDGSLEVLNATQEFLGPDDDMQDSGLFEIDDPTCTHELNQAYALWLWSLESKLEDSQKSDV